jgi:hypothetical protein
MRIILLALLAFAPLLHAADEATDDKPADTAPNKADPDKADREKAKRNKAEPFILRGVVFYEQAREIAAKADREVRPAERHALLGRARIAVRRASELAMQARREATADNRERVLAFQYNVDDLAYEISSERSQFRAPTDIVVQPVQPFRPNATILRQAARLDQLQQLRAKAEETPANLVRMAERARLDKWRMDRIAARVGEWAK